MYRLEYFDRFERAGWARGAVAVALLAIVVGWALPARADRRIFGYTYPYMTLPEGGFELEHYTDARIWDELDDPATPNDVETDYEIDWKHQVEAEYGITDHWDFGLYQVLRQKPFDSFRYEGMKLRTRYRFAEEGQLFVDPALYVEAGFFGDEVSLEQIVILGKRFGRLEVDLNLKFEEKFQVKGGDEWEFEFFPSLGVGYHITEWVALGVEYFGKMVMEEGEYEYFANYVGPTISVQGNHFWWTITFQPEVTALADAPTYQARSLFAVVF